MKALLQKNWLWPAALLLLWAGAIFVVNPIGEFPLNDDWAYSRNVHELAVNNKFSVDLWPAMTLVSQTLYGTLAAKLFGFSFTTLRLSMLLLAIAATLVLFFLLKRLSKNNFTAFLLSASFCFGQLFCALSFSFMTDIFFLSFVIFSLYALISFLDRQKWTSYALYVLFCLIAVLNRQHGLLLPLLIVPPLLALQFPLLKKIILAALPFTICFSAHLLYRQLLERNNIPHNIHGPGKLWHAVVNTDWKAVHKQAGDVLLSSGWMLFPLCVVLLFTQYWPNKKRVALLTAVAVVAAALLTFSVLLYFPIGNVFNSNGIGPRILKDYWINIIYKLHLPAWALWGIRITALTAALVLLVNSFGGKRNYFEEQKLSRAFSFSLLAFILVYFIFIAINVPYFDRYVLPLGLFLLLFNLPGKKPAGLAAKAVMIAITMCVYVFSLLETRDFMEWNRARYAGIAWLNSRGINEHFIDGGFEYNAWHKAGTGGGPEEERSWYWVDTDDYIIASGKHAHYRPMQFFTYRHFIPYCTDTLYVMEREAKGKLWEYENRIRQDKAWLESIQKSAMEKNIPTDSMIQLAAQWMVDRDEKLWKYERQIRQDKDWLENVRKSAIEKNIPLDSMIHLAAQWMIDNEKK